ncbi:MULTISPECIES: sensor histidine kinase [Vagococcus]|uniref:Two-component sensor histidine kinase n=1 Tax=Vagococcus fluvialis bH819 TaxID=1255619 RepID=A0A1X6WQJ9_9ENTE|nr:MULTISPECIES: sensor histidine kinase [Vagococcus]SLM86560.1 two-component sensor histidine kinase [Vagococcus fluvialis bH819]HCM90767.1 ATP-binding protein [Vagococcus sp.]
MDNLPNIPRDFTAIAEWFACLVIFLQVKKNDRNTWFVPILIGMGIGQVLLQRIVGNWSLFFWIFGMSLNVFWMFLTLQLTTKKDIMTNIYNVCKAFIFAEFIASLSWQLYCYIILDYSTQNAIVQYSFILILYIIFSFLYYYFETKNKKNIELTIHQRDVVIAGLTALIIFTMSNIGFMLSDTQFAIGDSFSIFIFRSLTNLCGVFIIYIQENQRYESYLRNELSAIHNVFHSQYEQYQAYKESTTIVNQKFHDLKHKIDLIEMETNSDKRKEYFQKIREDIQKYQSSIKTGNPVMDTILTRKNVFCIQNGIALTCIADGSLLNFLDVMDSCSLLGNTLDNAIESTLKTTNKEKRLINLRILEKADFILFSIENYSEEHITFENGLPKTTKKENAFHGYGLKSVSYIAEKYDGTMTIDYKKNWFIVNVLLPNPKKHA